MLRSETLRREFQTAVSLLHHFFCIGSIIHKVVIEQRITITTFARLIGLKRPNAYRIFSSMSLDTALLLRISRELHYDFFKHFSQMLEK